jgi:hypothetical protein
MKTVIAITPIFIVLGLNAYFNHGVLDWEAAAYMIVVGGVFAGIAGRILDRGNK